MLLQLRESMILMGNQWNINREEGISNAYSIGCTVILLENKEINDIDNHSKEYQYRGEGNQ
jgi:hypothetical protein